MTKNLKKTLATLLAMSMVLSIMSTAAFANEPESEEPENQPVVCAELEGCTEEAHDPECPLYQVPEELSDEDAEEKEEPQSIPMTELVPATKVEEETETERDEEQDGEANVMLAALENGSESEPQAEEPAELSKFMVEVSSRLNDGSVTTVTGTVDKDFNAKLVLPNKTVNAGNVTVKVSMNDVESLGGGNKSHSMTLNTGVNSEGNLFDALGTLDLNALKNFTGATINAVIKANGEEKSTTYTLAGETFNETEGKIITATPDANVRDAWHLMVNEANFEIGTQAADSKIIIANGSWLQIGTEKLRFEDGYTNDLVLDNIGEVEALIANIKAAVTLDEGLESALSFCLKKGTTLAVSSSYAKLKQDVNVTVDGIDNIPNVLSDIRANVNNPENGGKEIIIDLLNLMNTAIGLVDGKALTVSMEFGDTVEEPIELPKFMVEVSSKLNDGSVTTVTGTVDKDFNAKLVLPNKVVNAGNVTVKVSMNDVESLGGGNKSHSMTLNTGVNSEGNLFDALGTLELNALKNFTGATINAVIKANGEEKSTTYTLVGEEFSNTEGKIITATPDANVRDAWHLMVNEANFEIGTQAADSKIIIANGSWLQIGTEKLRFEDGYTNDLVLDNIGEVEALIANIKAAVTLDTGLENPALSFCLKKGTTLAVSSSFATLKQDVNVTVDGIENIPNVLSDIRANVNNPENGGKEIIIDLLNLMNTAIGLVDGKALTVNMEFGCIHTYGDPEWTWDGYTSATATFVCTQCDHEETVTTTAITNEVTTAATYDAPGVRTYTATVEFGGNTYTGTTTEEIAQLTRPYVPSYPVNPPAVDEDLTDPDTPLAEKPFIFADVVETDWFYEDVKTAFNLGLVFGVSDNAYDPYANSTRAMVAQILYRMEGEPSIADYDVDIPDLKTTDWFHDAAIWAYATGVYNGYEDGTFRGEKEISREELAVVLLRYAEVMGHEVSEIGDLSGYQDEGKVSDWALKSAQWAVGTGMLRGRAEDLLVPEDQTTRAELAVVLVRFINKYMPELAEPVVS